MLTKSVERLITKLKQKKQRQALKLFVAEGEKTIQELLQEGLEPTHLLVNDNRFAKVSQRIEVSNADFKIFSSLDTADGTLAIFPFPQFAQTEQPTLILILDNIRIPGNLGTIVRTADWFGINTIYCTTGTTDGYNSKSVQSSMGSIGRVQLVYKNNKQIAEILKDYTFYVTDMNGDALNTVHPAEGEKIALILGSESHGPSDFWKAKAKAVTISRKGNSKTESLNVAIAAAICMQHFS